MQGLKKILIIFLIIVLVIGLLGGILWVLDFFAVIKVYDYVYENTYTLPVVGKRLPLREKDKLIMSMKKVKSPQEQETDKFKDDIKKLNEEIVKAKNKQAETAKQLEVLNKEKQVLLEEKDSLKSALDTLQASNQQQTAAKLSYEKLALYFAEMKPTDAVKIMNNLTDEVNIGILQKLENEQVAKILSTMDPVKAAVITEKMRQ
jgi:flagellar motility protein MotE (MotC chaperone)